MVFNKTLLTASFLCAGGAALVAFLIAPILTALPNDFVFHADVVSVDDFYDAERSAYSGGVYSKTNFEYNVIAEEGEVLTIRNTFDVRTPDGEQIFSVERLYGINKYTGAHVAGFGDADREGYLFAPKYLQKGAAFTYWHINYDGPRTCNMLARTYCMASPYIDTKHSTKA